MTILKKFNTTILTIRSSSGAVCCPSYPNYAAPSHWHNDIEFIAVLSGQMTYNVNGKRISLRKDEGIFINSCQMHFGFSEQKEECEFLCILLHPVLLCTTSALERDFVLPVIHNHSLPFLYFHRDIDWQNAIFLQCKVIYEMKETPAAPLKIQAAFLKIWAFLYENMELDTKEEAGDGNMMILRNMIAFIQQNYKNKITLSEIAASGTYRTEQMLQIVLRAPRTISKSVSDAVPAEKSHGASEKHNKKHYGNRPWKQALEAAAISRKFSVKITVKAPEDTGLLFKKVFEIEKPPEPYPGRNHAMKHRGFEPRTT